MKRKVFLVAAMVGLVAIIGGMSSCKKEEDSIGNKKFDSAAVGKIFDYDKYIDDLSKETGIDIRNLSEDKVLITAHREVYNVANDLDVENFTREDSILFAQLYDQLIEAAQNLDMVTVNHLYNQLLHLLYGNNIPIYMLIDNVQDFAMHHAATLQQIENGYPQLTVISEAKKQEVLSAAFYLISTNGTKNWSVNDCEKQYEQAMQIAVLSYYVGMAGCVVASTIPFAGAACAIGMTAVLLNDLNHAETAYNRCKG
jgi:hypothetical protein